MKKKTANIYKVLTPGAVLYSVAGTRYLKFYANIGTFGRAPLYLLGYTLP
jgi:hypothetical protein